MVNGVTVPNISKTVKNLATGAKLYCEGNVRTLVLNGLEFSSSEVIQALIPSEDILSGGVYNSTLLAKSGPTSYKMGWISINDSGDLYGYYVENNTYTAATNYRAFGEITWILP